MSVFAFSPKRWGAIGGSLLAVLLLFSSGWMGSGRAAGQEGPDGPQAFSSGGTINFQGQVTDLGGAPLNGSYNLRFAIYDAAGGGNKKWPAAAHEEHSAVAVTNGLFSVQLGSIGDAISAVVFNGGGDRYLQVWVCTTAGAGCGTYDDMGRLPISSGAYAQTLSLPAYLEKSDASALLAVNNTGSGRAVSGQTTGDVALYGVASGVSGTTYGVHGRSNSTSGRGVYGFATAASGSTIGIFGEAASTTGRGVYGLATSTSGQTYGVLGASDSSSGRGVFGVTTSAGGQAYGVLGQSASTDGRGVYGDATAATGTTYGVYGQSGSEAGKGVYGLASNGMGYTYGVHGQSASTDGRGVYGEATTTSGDNRGVEGRSASTAGRGVFGYASASSGQTYGAYGLASSINGSGVFGWANATSGVNYGVRGQSDSASGRGVQGYASAASGTTYGVLGDSASTEGRGVYGVVTAANGATYGVYGQSLSTSGRGVYGLASAASGSGIGVYGRSDSAGGYGVYGIAQAASGTTYGVYGQSNSTTGYAGYFAGYGADSLYVANEASGRAIQAYSSNDTAIWGRTDMGLAGVDGRAAGSTGRGVYGYATSTTGANAGVYGRTASVGGRGVVGIAEATSGTNIGVYGETNSASGYAGYFADRVHVNGMLTKSSGSFKIDHPLDPANQYLYHSFVESPDMKNIYDGVATLDENGVATVTLPDWFEALNSDFRYQLTPIGAAMPDLHIARKVQGNTFQIAGGKPGMEVSWMVTGIRHDPYAEQNRIPVEEEKPAGEKGTYLYPQGYGQPVEPGRDYDHVDPLPVISSQQSVPGVSSARH